jgi:tryptophan synthase alpha subunit
LAAIVGSAIMRRVAQHRERGEAAVVESVGQFVSELAQGLTL